jgi:chemotaxis signal transduction protein
MNNETMDDPAPFDEVRAKGTVRKLQLFRAGPLTFGIFTDEIAATIAWREPTPLPLAPKSVLGVVSVQGRMLTVLDFTVLSGAEASSSDSSLYPPAHIIALRGDEQLALAVEMLGETVDVANGDVKPKPATSGALILGVFQLQDATINVLNTAELFPIAIQGRERRRRRF